MNGQEIEFYFANVAQHAFHFDLQQYLNAVNRSFIGLRFDPQSGATNSIFGNPPQAILNAINQPPLRPRGAAGGYQSAVGQTLLGQHVLSAANRAAIQALQSDVDVFLIANDVMSMPDILVKAIVFHECCHLYEQSALNTLQVTANSGQELRNSLTHPSFRARHTALLCDVVATASPNLVAFDGVFSDDLDLIGRAFQFAYEGNPLQRVTALLQGIAAHHVNLNNAPTFYMNGYLPEIDATYRAQVQQHLFIAVPGQQVTFQNNYIRECLRLSNNAFLHLQQQIAHQHP